MNGGFGYRDVPVGVAVLVANMYDTIDEILGSLTPSSRAIFMCELKDGLSPRVAEALQGAMCPTGDIQGPEFI